jgi:GNAT superfamily N-acetyltransferase
MPMSRDDEFAIRTDLRPGDIGKIVHRHGIYAIERGWDATFEAYVAGPLSELAMRHSPKERIWIAERDDVFAGCIAVVEASPETAQLRWLFVEPGARGGGLGSLLIREAITFARDRAYAGMILWTVKGLTSAARLYLAAGFRMADAKPGRRWGADVIEERYEMRLT